MAYISFQPHDHFNSVTYTGTGSSNTIAVGFQPDLTWIKNTGESESHVWFDAVRTNGYYLKSDANSAEIDGSSGGSGLWSAFAGNGFTVLNGNRTNDSSNSYASWNWKMNGAGSADSSGSASNVTVSADATRGMSIVRWQGSSSAQTVPHGLGGVPDIIMMKEQTATGNWIVSNKFGSWNGYILLNLLNAFYDSGDASSGSGRMFKAGGTEPSSTLFSTNGSAYMDSTSNYNIGYFFRSVKGFSKIGSYIGNGNVNGPMIYTGFSPAAVIAKKTSGTGDWIIWDNKRDGYNETLKRVYPNDPAGQESSTTQGVDFLSNGFKLRGTSSNAWNSGNDTYIFMAFAEVPLVASNETPATAR